MSFIYVLYSWNFVTTRTGLPHSLMLLMESSKCFYSDLEHFLNPDHWGVANIFNKWDPLRRLWSLISSSGFWNVNYVYVHNTIVALLLKFTISPAFWWCLLVWIDANFKGGTYDYDHETHQLNLWYENVLFFVCDSFITFRSFPMYYKSLVLYYLHPMLLWIYIS
jgi:hypothetical protein